MEKPFYQSSRLDYYEVIEFLLRRYSNLDFFNYMSITEFAKFYKVAKEQDLRERNFTAYCHYLPYMDKKTFISFEDYHKKCTGEEMDMRPAAEIMAEVEAIRREIDGNITI